jgi:hypothetical protein
MSPATQGVLPSGDYKEIRSIRVGSSSGARAALSMYQRAWACPPDHYFDAHTKYSQLAEKAARTVAMLTERLDHYRGPGQQQIVVKHVTVNADQALVTDTIVTGKNNEATTAATLVAASADTPMEIIEPTQKDGVPVGGGSKVK